MFLIVTHIFNGQAYPVNRKMMS